MIAFLTNFKVLGENGAVWVLGDSGCLCTANLSCLIWIVISLWSVHRNLLDGDNVKPTNPLEDLKLQLLDSLSTLILTTMKLWFMRISPSITASQAVGAKTATTG